MSNLSDYIKLLDNANKETRERASNELIKNGELSIDPLLIALKDAEGEKLYSILKILEKIGDERTLNPLIVKIEVFKEQIQQIALDGNVENWNVAGKAHMKSIRQILKTLNKIFDRLSESTPFNDLANRRLKENIDMADFRETRDKILTFQAYLEAAKKSNLLVQEGKGSNKFLTKKTKHNIRNTN